MKIKTNIRAGKQTQKQGSSVDSVSVQVTPPPAPITRCVGI